MRTVSRLLSLVLCVLVVASVLVPVTAFADGSKPGPDDLEGASKYLTKPKDSSWLDSYLKGYAYGPEYGRAANRYMSSTASKRSHTVAQGTALTALASERGRYLVKTEDGDIFWMAEACFSDRYVAPGRLKTDNADIDANGPSYNDLEGIYKDVERPGPKEWLDEHVECYVYAPKHHRAAEMLYYARQPVTEEAIEKGYDDRRQMGTVKQGTAITLLAHARNRYLVKAENGMIFWMYDWCTSDTLVPYGEAK